MNVGFKPTEVIPVNRRALGVPALLARRSNKVLRPRDAADVYAHPRPELARLTEAGVVRRLATGYYVMLPLNRLGDDTWRPDLDATALGVATADYGTAVVALTGISAARHHGAIPRAIAVAAVAVPRQRPAMHTEIGKIAFSKRDVARLDVERVDTELVSGWVTTVEQTLLDLAVRPAHTVLAESDLLETYRFLGRRADFALTTELAQQQHLPAALHRIRTSLEGSIELGESGRAGPFGDQRRAPGADSASGRR